MKKFLFLNLIFILAVFVTAEVFGSESSKFKDFSVSSVNSSEELFAFLYEKKFFLATESNGNFISLKETDVFENQEFVFLRKYETLLQTLYCAVNSFNELYVVQVAENNVVVKKVPLENKMDFKVFNMENSTMNNLCLIFSSGNFIFKADFNLTDENFSCEILYEKNNDESFIKGAVYANGFGAVFCVETESEVNESKAVFFKEWGGDFFKERVFCFKKGFDLKVFETENDFYVCVVEKESLAESLDAKQKFCCRIESLDTENCFYFSLGGVKEVLDFQITDDGKRFVLFYKNVLGKSLFLFKNEFEEKVFECEKGTDGISEEGLWFNFFFNGEFYFCKENGNVLECKKIGAECFAESAESSGEKAENGGGSKVLFLDETEIIQIDEKKFFYYIVKNNELKLEKKLSFSDFDFTKQLNERFIVHDEDCTYLVFEECVFLLDFKNQKTSYCNDFLFYCYEDINGEDKYFFRSFN
ncbi:MAG: hypothetical protein PUI24_05385 [Spirochaetales bacterium]|nr:hypothetical protein [Spirochaetales bacterium]